MRPNTKLLKIIFITIVLMAVVLLGIWNYRSLERKHNSTIAKVVDVKTSSKGGGAFVKYTYKIGQEELSNSSPIDISTVREYQFLYTLLKGKELPIIYQTNRPDNSRMLFSYKDLNQYKVTVSESQKEILNKIDSMTKNR